MTIKPNKTDCKYYLTILAEEMHEQNICCQSEPTRVIGGIDSLSPSGLIALDLCEKHYQSVSKWIEKH